MPLIFNYLKDKIMYKHIIKTMGDVDWMALIPLVLFISVFSITILIWALRNKTEVAEMANLPLKDGTKS